MNPIFTSKKILVAGGGGFIGGHLVHNLIAQGATVRSVDIKPLSDWYQVANGADNHVLDLKNLGNCQTAVEGCDFVFNLAADMGGMGFIESNKALCMLSVLINTHLILAAKEAGCVDGFLFSSSACVYAADKQLTADNPGLVESDAYPAMPEDGYGWEKLFSERMCRHFMEDYGIKTYAPRFHNVYGPYGTYDGGREKAPAAICRKIIAAKQSGDHQIEVWGDGEQTRSFMFVDDCVEGLYRLVAAGTHEPVNLGSAQMVTINELVDIVEEIAGIKVERRHNLDAPKGVRGRSSDNTRIKELLGWEPDTPLKDGMEKTYRWIHDQMK